MEKKLDGIILEDYRGVSALVELEESIDDIELAIKYTDYGEDFLLVKTNDHVYRYGVDGKVEIDSHDIIFYYAIDFIYYKGEFVNLNDTEIEIEYHEDWSGEFTIDLDQFN